MSDGWASYANIDRIGNGIYMHDVVVHQHHFVDPNDIDTQTENVENMWMRAKRKLRRQFGTSQALFTSYLHEFVFRNRFRAENMFVTVLKIISDNYPV
jgi:transposase-like protein